MFLCVVKFFICGIVPNVHCQKNGIWLRSLITIHANSFPNEK